MWHACDLHVMGMWHACDLLQLKTAEVEYSGVLMRWLVEREDRNKECTKSANNEDERRRRVSMDNEMQYQVCVWWAWQCGGRGIVVLLHAAGVAADQRHVV